MAKRFQDKVVIVTGSSNGFGREIARSFAAEGAKLTICGRSETSLKETHSLLNQVGAADDVILEVLGDLTDGEVQKRVIQETLDKFGKIDILVNNAGGVAPDATTEQAFDQSIETFDYVMNLNTRAVLILTKLAMPHLIESQGDVIMISSIAGLNAACPNYPYYAMSKAALDQLTRALASKYILDGVRVNSVNPGLCATDIWRKSGVTPDQVAKMEAAVGARRDCIPSGFVGESMDIASCVLFLADRQQSRFIVGHSLVVDGGSSLIHPIHNTSFMELMQ